MANSTRYDTQIAVEAVVTAAEERHLTVINNLAETASFEHQSQMADIARNASEALQRQHQDHALETQGIQRRNLAVAEI